MKIIIHRGTSEIGTSCVELISTNNRILLLSHFCLDHHEFLHNVSFDVPVYLSQAASLLIDVSNVFIPARINKLNIKIIKNKKSFRFGDFTITPLSIDHSPVGAMAFLVEADGKKFFYSDAFFATEEEAAQKRIEAILKEKKNIAFLFASSQSIDRIISAYKACLKTRSILVIDIYTAFILDKLKKVAKQIPEFNWKNIRIKFFKNQADALTQAGYRDLLYVYDKRKIDFFEINRNKSKILMLSRDDCDFALTLKEVDDVSGARIIYSMQEGYLTDRFRQYCDKKGLVIEHVRATGRSPEDVFVSEKEKYPLLFKDVKILDDGEELTID